MVEIETPHRDFWLKNKSFPFLTEDFPLSFAPSRHAMARYQADPQLNVIKYLLAKSKKVIIATDPTPQGDLMGAYLLRYLCFDGKVVRITLNDLMCDSIRNSIFFPYEDKEYTANVAVAEMKNRVDWLTNINLSRALGFATGRNTYPVSRISLPLLHLLDRRMKEIREYQLKTFHIPTITVKDNEGKIWAFRCTSEWEVIPSEIREAVKPGASVEVVDYETEEKDYVPLKLHNIDTLQLDAARTFGMDPGITYKIARGLYEKKRISFPGRSRGGISRRQYDDFKKNIWPQIQKATCFKDIIPEGYRPVYSNQAKAIEGQTHGIILTAFPFVGLSQEEAKIMFLIGRRMLCCFARNFRYEATKVTLQCGNLFFEGFSEKLIRAGFSQLMDYPELRSVTPPALTPGQALTVNTVGSISRTTSPPKVYKDYTLLVDAFESRHKLDRDEIAKSLLFLQDKGYLVRTFDGEYHLTESGRALCYVTRDLGVSRQDIVKYMDLKARERAEGILSEDDFISILHSYVEVATTELLACPKLFHPKRMEVTCPKCGQGMMQIFGKVVQCDHPECGHTINRQIAGVTLSSREVRNLVADGTTSTIRGFIASDGKNYCGKVVLDDDFSPIVIKVGK